MRPLIAFIRGLTGLVLLAVCGYGAEPTSTFLSDTDTATLNGAFGITIGKAFPTDCKILTYAKQPGGYLIIEVSPPKRDPLFSAYRVSVYSTQYLVFNITAVTKYPDELGTALRKRLGRPNATANGLPVWSNSARRIMLGKHGHTSASTEYLFTCGDIKLCNFLYAVDDYANEHPRSQGDETPDPMLEGMEQLKARQTTSTPSGSIHYVNALFGITLGDSLPRACVIHYASTNAARTEVTAMLTPPIPHSLFQQYSVTMDESTRSIFHLVAQTDTPQATLRVLREQWGPPAKEIDNVQPFKKFLSWDTKPGYLTFRVSDDSHAYLTCTDFGLKDKFVQRIQEDGATADAFLSDTDRRGLNGLFGITLNRKIPAGCEIVKSVRSGETYAGVTVLPPKPDPAFTKYIVCSYSPGDLVFRIIGITKEPDKVRSALFRHFGAPDLQFTLGKNSIVSWTNDTQVIQFVANNKNADQPQYLVSCGVIKTTSKVYDSDNYFKQFHK